ncbi:MAG: flavin-dependent oxidoreductase [Saprospiraceae bacterium]|nr:flavin-dependent oxidoreductase [Saprospiraceae bacterium]MCB9320412.1 flavin-dependent oxidoreductase [Lewinellaceae bacterium]
MVNKKKILIAGGGIGGLTAALRLHQAGFEVQVFESVKTIEPLGVGINTLPHCVRVLTNLGLQEKLQSNAVETSDLVYFNRLGQQFWSEPRGRFAGYKWPQFSIHRGTLQMILFDEVIRRIGPGAILSNHHLDDFSQDPSGITAHFIDKETGETVHTETGDLLIGADGINSVVRSLLYPGKGIPVYSENVLYRGTTMMKPFLNGQSMIMVGSNRLKMVAYPILPVNDTDGRQLINWVANVKEGKSALTVRDWNRESDKGRLLDLYGSWQFDWLDVPEMIRGAGAIYEFPMSDRDPLSRWSFGRVTLLGDAAHPMYPIGSNGASQAILDADWLSQCLLTHDDVTQALLAYDTERVPATGKIVLQNRAKGPDQIMDLMEDRFPHGFEAHEIPHQELKKIMDQYRKIAGFDRESLNQMQ